MGAVADAVGVELGDRLEDALGTVGLAGVNRLLEEVAVRELVGLDVVRRRMAGLGAGEVEADHRQAQPIARLDHRARQRQRPDAEDLGRREAVEHLEHAAVVGTEAGPEEPQRAGDDAVVERRLAAHAHRVALRVLAAHALEAAIDRRDHRRHVEAGPHVELRREAHLDVADAFVQAVLAPARRRRARALRRR